MSPALSVVPVAGVVHTLRVFLWSLDKCLLKSVHSEQG